MVKAAPLEAQAMASRVTFGTAKGNRMRSIQIGLAAFGFLALALDYVDQTIRLPGLWVGCFLCLGIWLISVLWYAEELTLDFNKGIYLTFTFIKLSITTARSVMKASFAFCLS